MKKSGINCNRIECQMERNACRTKERTIVLHLTFSFKVVITHGERDCEATEDSKRIR